MTNRRVDAPHARYGIEITRTRTGVPKANVVRRVGQRAYVTAVTAADLTDLLAEAAAALKIIEDHRESRTP